MGFTMLISENDRTAPYRISQLASGRQRLSDFHWARRSDGRVRDGNQTGTISMIGRERNTDHLQDRWRHPRSSQFYSGWWQNDAQGRTGHQSTKRQQIQRLTASTDMAFVPP